jgi:nucleotide-binding universal stress UspA family protein
MTDYNRIMIPVDFSKNSPKLLKAATEVAEKFQAELFLVFVVQSFEDYSGFFVPHMPISQFEDEMMESAEKKMEAFVSDNLKTSLKYSTEVLKGDVAEELTRYASENNVAMIIMGTHGYKGVERVIFGSVAEKVVKTSPCPVLTINPYK